MIYVSLVLLIIFNISSIVFLFSMLDKSENYSISNSKMVETIKENFELIKISLIKNIVIEKCSTIDHKRYFKIKCLLTNSRDKEKNYFTISDKVPDTPENIKKAKAFIYMINDQKKKLKEYNYVLSEMWNSKKYSKKTLQEIDMTKIGNDGK